MAINRGKQFEKIIKEAFLKVDNVSLDRLSDPMAGYVGIKNICDYIVYKYPYQYYIECKSCHGNTFPFSNITDNQYNGLLEKRKVYGVVAGCIVWFVDKDITLFVPIEEIEYLKSLGYKSIRYDILSKQVINIPGTKKRVFYDYDMKGFFEIIERNQGLKYE